MSAQERVGSAPVRQPLGEHGSGFKTKIHAKGLSEVVVTSAYGKNRIQQEAHFPLHHWVRR